MSDDKKFAQISNESIQTWAETVGVTDLSPEILRTLGADVTYRLHQALSICHRYLNHSNRRRLTSDDFNRALQLMDVSPVYGYSGSEAVDWVGVSELGMFVPHDPPVNLASIALSGDIFHQPGNTYVKGKWAHVSGHLIMKSENSEEKSLSSLPLSPPLIQYYRTLFSVTTNPSATLFETMCEDVGTSPNVGPLVGPIIRSILKGAQKANQKPLILRRLLLIVKALLFNSYIHLGPQNYIHDIVKVLVFSVVTERKNPQDTQSIRTLASNILLKLSRKEGDGGSAWELAVISLSGVVGSGTRPWTQHAGALTGLIPLGFNALYRALLPVVSEYYTRLCQTLSNSPSAALSSAILAKDTLDANMTYGLLLVSFVNMMVSFIKHLPDRYKILLGRDQNCRAKSVKRESRESAALEDLIQKAREAYYLGEEMFGSAFVLQVPTLYLFCDAPTTPFWSIKETSYLDDFLDEELHPDAEVPPHKRRKMITPVSTARIRRPASLGMVFEGYRPMIPLTKRKIYMCIGGCSTRKFEFLKQKRGGLPLVTPHPNRPLLVQYNKGKKIGRMPHWTFIRPLPPSIKPPSTINYLIL